MPPSGCLDFPEKECGLVAIARFILKAANSLLTLAVLLVMLLAGAFSAYALWDNGQIYAAAENVQADMLSLKPSLVTDEGTDGAQTGEQESASFEELLAINEDVCGWITMDNTRIDFPILQGESNLSYINTDVYGNFALAGSIFLDFRNDSGFTDPYSVLYGHHMENRKMFGDLDLYKEKSFFDENRTGLLILPDRAYQLEVIACMLVTSTDDMIFDPDELRGDIAGLMDYAQQEAMYYHQETLDAVRQSEDPQILALTTCSAEFTNARTIILTAMIPYALTQ